MPEGEKPTATLIVNLYNSKCSACGRDADPYEPAHITRLGYDPGEGCGAEFVDISINYTAFGELYERIQEMRPDLPFIRY